MAGASIAGPALAHWLRRRGAGVTVVERAPGLRPGGQAVDARGVTREVIRRMGLDAAVRAARTETAGAYTVDVDGNVLETYRADDDGGDGYISEIEILRGDLSRVLHDDTRDGVEYIFGDRIAELTQDADGVDVAFAGGGRRRFDLVVGADGLHSALRAMVFGPHERFVRHLGHVMAFYTVPNEFWLGRWLIDYQESGSGRWSIRNSSRPPAAAAPSRSRPEGRPSPLPTSFPPTCAEPSAPSTAQLTCALEWPNSGPRLSHQHRALTGRSPRPRRVPSPPLVPPGWPDRGQADPRRPAG